ncbi:threonine/serine dehydratase [Streptomyces sp. NPDC047081]|uniref:threonine ammonia-lyase n=1 Tax=Streptomyces sp. NPDC047081 TaxID=3154706 RepID=UPI0033D6460D
MTTDAAEELVGEGSFSADLVREAARRLHGVAHRTPVLTSGTLDRMSGASLVLKAENFQRTGSFKFRGAYNAVAGLSREERERGVCAFSSGNHAQAVALASALLGTRATVLMPDDAPQAKRSATEGYGARVIAFDRYRDDRAALAASLSEREGLTMVHAFDDHRVMAGQGTAALELIEDGGPIDVLIVPMSGGGLMAGCGTAARELLPGVELVGVEPETADDTARSLAAGQRVQIPIPHTIADGLQADMPGELTFAVNRRQVDEIVTVSDSETVEAMRLLFERLKLVVEPSGATALAAVLAHPSRFADRRVGIIVSGGNVNADTFATLIASSKEK